MSRKSLVAVAVLAVGLVFANVGHSMEPDTFVRRKLDRAMEIVCDTADVDALASDTTQEELIETFENDFDYEEMTLRILGPHARRVSDEQLNRLVKIFKQLLQVVYVERLTRDLAEESGTYRLNSIEIGGVEKRREGRYARVQSTASLVWDNEDYTAEMYYYLIRHEASWKIYDFEVEGIGLIKNYRRQFSSFLANNSIDDLIARLRKQIKGDVSADSSNLLSGSE